MRVAILVVDEVFDSGLTVLLDTFATANEVAFGQGIASPLFHLDIVGSGRSIRTALGFAATVEPASGMQKPDWIVVPAVNVKQPEQLIEALGRKDVLEAIAYLRAWHAPPGMRSLRNPFFMNSGLTDESTSPCRPNKSSHVRRRWLCLHKPQQMLNYSPFLVEFAGLEYDRHSRVNRKISLFAWEVVMAEVRAIPLC